jgi:hypothetical protein
MGSEVCHLCVPDDRSFQSMACEPKAELVCKHPGTIPLARSIRTGMGGSRVLAAWARRRSGRSPEACCLARFPYGSEGWPRRPAFGSVPSGDAGRWRQLRRDPWRGSWCRPIWRGVAAHFTRRRGSPVSRCAGEGDRSAWVEALGDRELRTVCLPEQSRPPLKDPHSINVGIGSALSTIVSGLTLLPAVAEKHETFRLRGIVVLGGGLGRSAWRGSEAGNATTCVA